MSRRALVLITSSTGAYWKQRILHPRVQLVGGQSSAELHVLENYYLLRHDYLTQAQRSIKTNMIARAESAMGPQTHQTSKWLARKDPHALHRLPAAEQLSLSS